MKLSYVAGIAGAAALWVGSALAAPPSQDGSTVVNRPQLIAAQMAKGLSYDRASRVVAQESDERDQAIRSEMEKGKTYREARTAIAERDDLISTRWTKHRVAMEKGGSHEAGWTASAAR